jgi:hypothetical protein
MLDLYRHLPKSPHTNARNRYFDRQREPRGNHARNCDTPDPRWSARCVGTARSTCAHSSRSYSNCAFAHYGAKMGFGMAVDCIRPTMLGTPQRKQATKALPQIDPEVVAACKKRNPNFGKGGRAKLQSTVQPTPKSSST